MAEYHLLPASLTCTPKSARDATYPYSMPPASRAYTYSVDTCPTARDFTKRSVRWSTFCETYTPEHCELAANLVRHVADRIRA